MDHLLLASDTDFVETIIFKLGSDFALSTISHGPGTLGCYGLKIHQNDDFTCTMDGNDKLQALESFSFFRPCSHERDEHSINLKEIRSYLSTPLLDGLEFPGHLSVFFVQVIFSNLYLLLL